MSTLRRAQIGVSHVRMGTVYLLEITPAYKHCRHYIGFTKRTMTRRLAEHRRGEGSALTKAAVEAGCTLEVVRVWLDVDQSVEMILKSRAESKALCPECSGPAAYRRAQYDRPGTCLAETDTEQDPPEIGAF